jgi:hypothetical protein
MKSKLFFASVLFLWFLSSCKYFNSVDPAEKNLELQKLEIDIQRKISEGDKNGALYLLKELVHPSPEQWIEKQKQTDMDQFINGGNQYYTYNEWWSKRREEFQKQILAMETRSDRATIDTGILSTDSLSTITEDTSQTEEAVVAEPVQLSANYLGLYVMQFANGSTKFYKFFKDASGNTGVVYQDNVAGNVRVENYVLRSFNENSMEVVLESKKNSGSFVNVRFVADQESENGFKLLDSDGSSYSVVGN